jgi:protein TonB
MAHQRPIPASAEVFTVREIAAAAGAAISDVRARLDPLAPPGAANPFVSFDVAVRVIGALRTRSARPRPLFALPEAGERGSVVPLAASGGLHTAMIVVLLLVTGLGMRSEPTEAPVIDSARLVFLAAPGPGGGGGGGGLRQPRPARPAEVRGRSTLRSPVTVARAVRKQEPDTRVENAPPAIAPEPLPEAVPPPPAPEATPPVTAPVVSVPADQRDQTGVVTDSAGSSTHGTGSGGGSGSGRGPGAGEGDGAGIGAGSTAGIGGGPYRPGVGITPPSLLREVKPIYTDEGRRRGVEGEVVLEVVVKADGTVGSIRTIRGLGSGLDQRATDAVRAWRFSSARRYGTPVDVLVEVAVEFRLR